MSKNEKGNSEQERIVYQASKGEKAEIKDSETIKGWQNLTAKVPIY